MMQNLYAPGELLRYINGREMISYLPVLASNDVTKYEAVRDSAYRDACNALCAILDSR